MSTPEKNHKSDSTFQKEIVEPAIREAFEKELKEKCNIDIEIKYGKKHPLPIQESEIKLELDGFSDDPKLPEPILIEIWAHQGKAKPGQINKVMKDMCKLLLAERLLGEPCQKYLVVSDKEAISFLKGKSWLGNFAKKFGIKTETVTISEERIEEIKVAQNIQKMVNPSL